MVTVDACSARRACSAMTRSTSGIESAARTAAPMRDEGLDRRVALGRDEALEAVEHVVELDVGSERVAGGELERRRAAPRSGSRAVPSSSSTRRRRAVQFGARARVRDDRRGSRRGRAAERAAGCRGRACRGARRCRPNVRTGDGRCGPCRRVRADGRARWRRARPRRDPGRCRRCPTGRTWVKTIEISASSAPVIASTRSEAGVPGGDRQAVDEMGPQRGAARGRRVEDLEGAAQRRDARSRRRLSGRAVASVVRSVASGSDRCSICVARPPFAGPASLRPPRVRSVTPRVTLRAAQGPTIRRSSAMRACASSVDAGVGEAERVRYRCGRCHRHTGTAARQRSLDRRPRG